MTAVILFVLSVISLYAVVDYVGSLGGGVSTGPQDEPFPVRFYVKDGVLQLGNVLLIVAAFVVTAMVELSIVRRCMRRGGGDGPPRNQDGTQTD